MWNVGIITMEQIRDCWPCSSHDSERKMGIPERRHLDVVTENTWNT